MKSGAATESTIHIIDENTIGQMAGEALTLAGLGVFSAEAVGTIMTTPDDSETMTTAHGNAEHVTGIAIPPTGVTAAAGNAIAITIATTAHGAAIAITTTTSLITVRGRADNIIATTIPRTGVIVVVGTTTVITIATIAHPAIATITIATSGPAMMGGGFLLNGNLY